ncbi:DUF2442 domain-containing protein [soil metagenome]
MLNKVVDVKVLAPHVLRVTFADGFSAVHDFAALVNEDGPMAEPLHDPAYFARVFLEYGALTWPNGYDMCPDWLRMEVEQHGAVKSPAAAE